MYLEFQAGATVRARGGRFLILGADTIAQGSGDPICRLRLRALDEPFRNEEIYVLHPIEKVDPDDIPELDLARPGRWHPLGIRCSWSDPTRRHPTISLVSAETTMRDRTS